MTLPAPNSVIEAEPAAHRTVIFVRDRTPKVSIGMPIYNGAGPFLLAALDGILLQDYPNVSILISNNASTDDTLAIVRARCANDKRVTIRSRATLAPADVHYNEVLEHAPSSEFFMWAAHDDVFFPTYVSRCVELFRRYPQALSAGSAFRLIDMSGHTIRFERNIHSVGMDLAEKTREIARRFGWYSFYNLMRRSELEKAGALLGVYGSDVLFTMELLVRGDFVADNEPLFAFRMPAARLTAQQYLEKAHSNEGVGHAPLTQLFGRVATIVRSTDATDEMKARAEGRLSTTIALENAPLLLEIQHENADFANRISESELRKLFL